MNNTSRVSGLRLTSFGFRWLWLGMGLGLESGVWVGGVVAGLAAHTGASTGAEHERFIALLEETRRRLGPRGMRGAWSAILEPPITSMAASQCWSAKHVSPWTTHPIELGKQRTAGGVVGREPDRAPYTRQLPLTSCQEGRLGLDYTVLCHLFSV